MAEDPEERERLALEEALERERRRREAARREEGPALWRHLSILGALGWMIVVPTLLAVLLGRWLDARFGTGVKFTLVLILAGIVLSGWLAWNRVKEEEED
ncbi:MAG: AtpZ/AtpI family protein [Alphaproteobacteria bacterium]|nr:MAG: AtpZ/AtpI family protein [Alphaproteobacteria bacterium]